MMIAGNLQYFKKPAILFVCIFFMFVFPFVLSAQVGQIVGCDTDCDYNYLITGIQNLLNFLIYLAGIIAVVMFIYSGVLLIFSGGNSSQKEKAKAIFKSVVIGFIITITAYLIVSAVLGLLLDSEKDIETPLGDIEASA